MRPRYRSLVLPLLLSLAACGVEAAPDTPHPRHPTITTTISRDAPHVVCYDLAGYSYRTDRCP